MVSPDGPDREPSEGGNRLVGRLITPAGLVVSVSFLQSVVMVLVMFRVEGVTMGGEPVVGAEPAFQPTLVGLGDFSA